MSKPADANKSLLGNHLAASSARQDSNAAILAALAHEECGPRSKQPKVGGA